MSKRVYAEHVKMNTSPHAIKVKGRCPITEDEYYYHSMSQAADDGWSLKGIRMCLRGKQITSNGLFWAVWDGRLHEDDR